MTRPPKRKNPRPELRVAVELGDWHCPYSISPHYDRKRGETYFETMHLEAAGEIVRIQPKPRLQLGPILLSISENATMPAGNVVDPPGVGIYWRSGRAIEIWAYVPPGRLATLSTFAVAGRLGWATMTWSYPDRGSGRLISISLANEDDPDDWE